MRSKTAATYWLARGYLAGTAKKVFSTGEFSRSAILPSSYVIAAAASPHIDGTFQKGTRPSISTPEGTSAFMHSWGIPFSIRSENRLKLLSASADKVSSDRS